MLQLHNEKQIDEEQFHSISFFLVICVIRDIKGAPNRIMIHYQLEYFFDCTNMKAMLLKPVL